MPLLLLTLGFGVNTPVQAADKTAEGLNFVCGAQSIESSGISDTSCRAVIYYNDGSIEYDDLTATKDLNAFADKVAADYPNDVTVIKYVYDKGYDPVTACNDGQCATLALKNKPAATGVTAYTAPSSGDPAASIWQNASTLTAVIAVGAATGTVLLQRRKLV